ncbi:transmembrane protein 273 isoform X2 [Rousettus aegyptiacus]|uniref:transmembrane protein 273 isoform X2 n=1 Tax=Rousettus aegyptiacus TaxID=9407 RepID=UPI000786ADD1|nr:transmembrane protein 273 isoform X2 [Rousettus aegyptiacus]XP_015991152.1 transmembrane protein 273 isoform X2 [Rousettus aegyptiacus]
MFKACSQNLTRDVGGAQVLATEKSARAETDIKYAIIGTALGVAISAVFLALKYCMIKKHLFDNDSSDLRSTHLGFNDTTELKKRIPRLNLNYPESPFPCGQLLGMKVPEDRPSWMCLGAPIVSHCVCECNVLSEGHSDHLTLWFAC